jgi:hypothetical protein
MQGIVWEGPLLSWNLGLTLLSRCYNHRVKRTLLILVLCVSVLSVRAQDAPPAASQKPEVRVNVINVCSPSDDDQKEMAAALERIPQKAAFAPDFEISRGRSTYPEAPVAHWVRVRREFGPQDYFSSAQYSMSLDENSIVETVVLRVRDPKEVLQISIEDRVSGAMTPAAVLAANTPADRVKIERYGKSSLVLARCPEGDQSKYEALFQSASRVLARYRDLLGARRTVPADMARLGPLKPPAKPAAGKKPAPEGAAAPPR